MPHLKEFPAQALIRQLEQSRQSRVLVFAASRLDMEHLPALYEQCREMGHSPRLDVLIQSRGGAVVAARRIALLLREFCDRLSFIVPYYCESSSTILALAADEIIAGDLAIFSPIDPHLHGGVSDDEAASMFSSMDIKMFGAMSEDWFGVSSEEARMQALSLLCGSIFPPTLTAFYRTTLELEQIGEELLAFQLPQAGEEARRKILKQLMYGFHSHGYPITRGELAAMGLNIRREPEVEALSWEVSRLIQKTVGRGLNRSDDEPWIDALMATRDGVKLRERAEGGYHPRWTEAAY
ncbi:hypothetical protein [Massilia sp. BJB1822]|uniref:SDH family Clp fold serine proteinase n=1 Tax=Massilia sp. BJB1822 TaxID=2744470 RepID=UPI001594B0DE|nr:hypothetical protein [Massilia sp. BJB1822]NVE00277.1 hypothetical protein [Massilia sp. BJB1822]